MTECLKGDLSGVTIQKIVTETKCLEKWREIQAKELNCHLLSLPRNEASSRLGSFQP